MGTSCFFEESYNRVIGYWKGHFRVDDCDYDKLLLFPI